MPKKEIIVLSWHPAQSDVSYAGGFRRLYEILLRVPSDVNVTCLDTNPSFLKSIYKNNINLIEYKIPKLISKLTNLNFLVGKAVERVYVTIYLVKYLVFLKTNKIVYVPFSELPHLSIAAVIGKLFRRHKLVFCNLNPNTYFLDRIINVIAHKLSDVNITISNSLQSQLLKSGIICNIVNPVGIDTRSYKVSGEKSKTKTGIFVGRHVQEKGIYAALEVCAEINKTQHFILNCVGDIPADQRQKIENLIQKLNIGNKVNLLGIVDEKTKTKLLTEATVCLFPSTQEGWGIVPQEAILCGTPVVAYDLAVYKENITGCPAVKLVPINDVAEFIKQIHYWFDISKKDLDKKLKESVTIVKKFDWAIIAKKEWGLICQI